MSHRLEKPTLDQLFFAARTHNAWQDKPVEPALLRDLVDLMKWAPTSVNMSPVRIVFVVSQEAKARLKPLLMVRKNVWP